MLETKIAEMLDQLANKLGVASTKVWEWSMLQVKVDVITDLILIVFAVVSTISVSVLLIKSIKAWRTFSKENKYGDDTKYFATTLIFSCIGLGVIILDLFAIGSLLELPKLLINPEYAAFQNIVEQLGKLK